MSFWLLVGSQKEKTTYKMQVADISGFLRPAGIWKEEKYHLKDTGGQYKWYFQDLQESEKKKNTTWKIQVADISGIFKIYSYLKEDNYHLEVADCRYKWFSVLIRVTFTAL